MTGKNRQRLHVWLAILAAATAWAGSAAAQVQREIVLSEDFEGEGKDFARGWAGPGLKRDTVVFRNGRASLRVHQAAGADTFGLDAPGFPAAVGQNYRISFWIKADERVQVQVSNYPEGSGSGLVGGACVTTLNWRKIVCGGRVSGVYGFTGGPTHFWWLIRNRKKEVTIWIDDFRVEEAGDFATDSGWTPVAEGRNLIPNASFEADPGRHYVQWGSTRNDRGPDQNWDFAEDAAFGSRSLKLPGNPDPAYGICHRGPQLEMIHPLAFDSGNADFTLSASVKSADGRAHKVTLLMGPASNTDVPVPSKSITLEMTATGEWTRHRKTFRLPRAEDGKCWLYVRGGDVLIDGLMLARGKSSAFTSRQSVEASLSSSKPWRIYEPNDPLVFTLRAVRHAPSPQPSPGRGEGVEMTLVNYRHQAVRKLKWQVDAEPGRVIEREVTLNPLPQGCYRAELRMMGSPAVLSEITFSIMPQPRRVPYTQSNWGVATIGGVDFNTYDWDISPMFLRLGFHWARVLSSAALEDVGGVYTFRGMSPEEGLRAGDLWVSNLKKHGMGIYAILVPRMITQTGAGNPHPPKTEAEYADYEANVREIVARFGDRIDYWEVSNEPALPVVTPENYGRMVRETVRILRETDPTGKVISIAGGANGDREWIEETFRAGAITGVDGISFHYAASGGGARGETLERYRPWREWALQGKGGKDRPLEVWDSEEHVEGPSFYPVRVQSATGLQDLGVGPAYPARFCRDFKVYLYNSAMNVRTMCFNAEYSMTASGFERGFWERDGGLTPATVASFLAAQMMQTMKGGGLHRMPHGLFGALVHDKEQSILAVWSKKYTGTTKLKQYKDPFDMLDQAPRPVEDLTEIPDFYRDVHPVKLKVPDGVKVLDCMTVPVKLKAGEITVDIYPLYLIVPRAAEGELLKALGAEQMLKPIPRPAA